MYPPTKVGVKAIAPKIARKLTLTKFTGDNRAVRPTTKQKSVVVKANHMNAPATIIGTLLSNRALLSHGKRVVNAAAPCNLPFTSSNSRISKDARKLKKVHGFAVDVMAGILCRCSVFEDRA